MESKLVWTTGFLLLVSFGILQAESKTTTELSERLDAARDRRANDVSPVEVVQQQHTERLQTLEAEVAAMKEKLDHLTTPLLFTATTGPTKHYAHGQIILFPRIVENVGDIPDDADDINDNLFVNVMVNSVAKITAYAFHGVPSSGAGALTLEQGDRVWVQTANGDRDVEPGTLFSIVRISS
ncbi:hypothetical protein BaRGS_00035756 [Batillaria attramentaria]|uniref:Uncharacterized protein n=1 Tax=Batillaria attramentaria TaxID=370345 RepID=A0ABD0JDT7_9CAEN